MRHIGKKCTLGAVCVVGIVLGLVDGGKIIDFFGCILNQEVRTYYAVVFIGKFVELNLVVFGLGDAVADSVLYIGNLAEGFAG